MSCTSVFAMKTLTLIIAGLALTAGWGQAGQWKLVWSDEFNYHGLPDTNKWDYEEGFVRNREAQYYTRARLENARVEKGRLVIECRKEHFKPDGHEAVEYTSASLITLNRASWQYGRIEMRAKIPHGGGVWPAFWTLGTNITQVGWPASGEMDIMEFFSTDTNHIYGTAHYAVAGRHRSDGGRVKTDQPYKRFHVYAIEWYPDRIDFFFDHQKYHTVSIDKAGQVADNPFRKPHYLILNFALGGASGGRIDDANLPQQYLVDYVRVYQLKGAPQPKGSPP